MSHRELGEGVFDASSFYSCYVLGYFESDQVCAARGKRVFVAGISIIWNTGFRCSLFISILCAQEFAFLRVPGFTS